MKSVTPSVQFHNLHSHHTVVEMCAIRLSVRIKTAAPQTIVFGLSRLEGGERENYTIQLIFVPTVAAFYYPFGLLGRLAPINCTATGASNIKLIFDLFHLSPPEAYFREVVFCSFCS